MLANLAKCKIMIEGKIPRLIEGVFQTNNLLAGVRVLTVLVSSFVPALLAFGFLSGSAKRESSPVCGFSANGGGGSVVLRCFA